jgi:hypothetical protein
MATSMDIQKQNMSHDANSTNRYRSEEIWHAYTTTIIIYKINKSNFYYKHLKITPRKKKQIHVIGSIFMETQIKEKTKY